ncbi:TetR/AcrR family transcriptional regulator [Actinopolymorpha pittospori]|uniref:AcrR family transcriptional regulator n=1 Tax=Actinopolymorpha pittospori TaxID=648752 RepID=A0A927RQC0_9ACTN|nr:TetR/AcrR family transcriptional regulator [Actinopolymorpha pittospori]MBE1612961.1 AcrR family transcriptional regulator [Actinopolymorpha pittospori]
MSDRDHANPSPDASDPTPLGDPPPPSGTAPRGPGARPGGRSARNRAAVLAAVEGELVEHGFDGLTVEGVAARSGVHRTSVYRRWGDVGGLLADLLRAGQEDDWRPSDTGSLGADLAALGREVLTALHAEPPVMRAVVGASFRSAAAAQALRDFWADRYRRCRVVVERAIYRGEVPPGTDPDTVLVAATAPLFHTGLLLGTTFTDADVLRHANGTTIAARAGAYADSATADSAAADDVNGHDDAVTPAR